MASLTYRPPDLVRISNSSLSLPGRWSSFCFVSAVMCAIVGSSGSLPFRLARSDDVKSRHPDCAIRSSVETSVWGGCRLFSFLRRGVVCDRKRRSEVSSERAF